MALFKKKPKKDTSERKDEKKGSKKTDGEGSIYNSALRLLTAEGWKRRMKKR